MLFYIAAYVFIALATAIAVYDVTAPSRNELFASAVTGLWWPLLFTVKIISKILR